MKCPEFPRRRSKLGQCGPRGTWLPADGRRLYIAHMESEHLTNSIALIERRFRERPTDERHLGIERLFPKYAELVEEARRRRLIPRASSRYGHKRAA